MSERLKEALEKIAARSQETNDPEFEPSDGVGNYDDCFYNGKAQEAYECAAIAREALTTPPAPDNAALKDAVIEAAKIVNFAFREFGCKVNTDDALAELNKSLRNLESALDASKPAIAPGGMEPL